MSYSVDFNLLSLADLFRLRSVMAYEYEGDIILAASDGDQTRLLHLIENEVDGDTMYGLTLGQLTAPPGQPFFVGNPSTVEVALVKNETDWDFQSLLLKNYDGSSLRVGRNNLAFPEPTLTIIRVSEKDPA